MLRRISLNAAATLWLIWILSACHPVNVGPSLSGHRRLDVASHLPSTASPSALAQPSSAPPSALALFSGQKRREDHSLSCQSVCQASPSQGANLPGYALP